VDAKGEFSSLAEPWADIGTSIGRLMITMLSGLADVERVLIRTWTPDGPTPGTYSGRSSTRPPDAAQRGATLDELARSYNVGIPTIRRATRSASVVPRHRRVHPL
jgi:DNA invertase Pin-like site-specific DNA recombinase